MATYLRGIERQYVYDVLFRDITTGTLHPRGDLAVRALGGLLGFADIRAAAEQLGFTEWTVTPDDARLRFDHLYRIAALTPSFRDMYEEQASDRRVCASPDQRDAWPPVLVRRVVRSAPPQCSWSATCQA